MSCKTRGSPKRCRKCFPSLQESVLTPGTIIIAVSFLASSEWGASGGYATVEARAAVPREARCLVRHVAS